MQLSRGVEGNTTIYFSRKAALVRGKGEPVGKAGGGPAGSSLQPHTDAQPAGDSLPADPRAGGSQLLLSVGVQPTFVPACPEPCVLPWAAPGGRAGWWDGLLSCVGCAVPAGAAVWHQAIQPPPVLRLRAGRDSPTSCHGHTGCSSQTCSGRELELVSSPLASGRLRGGCCRQVLLSLLL